MRLADLLKNIITIPDEYDLDIPVLAMTAQACVPGALFIQQKIDLKPKDIGQADYLSLALAKGARVVVQPAEVTAIERSYCQQNKQHYLLILLPDLKNHLVILAQRFYSVDFTQTKFIGVTGTNGKSSCVRLITEALTHLGHSAAMIGTLGAGFLTKLTPTGFTTPDIFKLYEILAELIAQRVEYVIMEVSSHALDQNRIAGLPFDTVVFTNLTREHLDYHGSMASYLAAKQLLFRLPNIHNAVVNIDDLHAPAFLDCCVPGVKKYTVSTELDQVGKVSFALLNATVLPEGYEICAQTNTDKLYFTTRLMGQFNISNLLVVAAVLSALGFAHSQLTSALTQLTPVPGRLERISYPNQPCCVLDYAHTPDALVKALQACKALTKGKLYCLFGCGGDRDKGKRPLMAQVAEQYADSVIITNDNPRTEEVMAIINEIVTGFSAEYFANHVTVVCDRALAIERAIKLAQSNDMILIAGKGHEDYQIIGTKRVPFSDKKLIKQVIEALD